MAKLTTDSDAKFLRELVAVNAICNGSVSDHDNRLLGIAARLEQLDQQEPSEAECIVWAMRKGQLYPAERGDYGKKVWVYLGEDESVEIDAGLRHDAPKLESDTLADIRRRMKEAANA